MNDKQTNIIVGADLGNVVQLAETQDKSYDLILSMIDDMSISVFDKFQKTKDMKLPRVFSNLISTRLSVTSEQKNTKELQQLREEIEQFRELMSASSSFGEY